MSLTVIKQDINKAALTIDLDKIILGDRIIAAEIPLDRSDIVMLCPMAAHLFNTINSADALGENALQNVSFARVGNSDRVTLALHADATKGINLKWDPKSIEAATALITETMKNPINVAELVEVSGISYTEHQPINDDDAAICDAVYQALAHKTNRDGGQMTILSTQFEEKSRTGFFSNGSSYLVSTVIVKATGTCGGCAGDSITFKMGRKKANDSLPNNIQVGDIASHPDSAKLLIRLAL